MVQIPQNIQSLHTYKPGKSSNKILEQEPIVLCSNENNFGPSPLAMQAIRLAADQVFLYPDPTGDLLREKLADRVGVEKQNIVLGNGSDAILYTLFNAFFEPGDSILTSHGSFVSLYPMAQMNRVPVEKVSLTRDYAFDLEAILDHIQPHTKAIYLCNPNNPTGTMISEDQLTRFLDQVPSDILVVVDEAYYEFASSLSEAYPDSSRLAYDNVISMRTFSKAFGLAGVRLGYTIGPAYLIEALTKVKLTFNPNLLAQAAGVAALSDKAHVKLTLENNRTWLGRFYQAFDRLGLTYVPSYANFVMLDMKTEEKAKQFCDQLKQQGILIRHLDSFGLPHCVRVSVGRPEENEAFLKSIKLLLPNSEAQKITTLYQEH